MNCSSKKFSNSLFTARCYEEAEKCGLPLYCAFMKRFDPTYRAVTLRAKGGEIGKLQIVKTIARDSPYPDVSCLVGTGGIFHDFGIHDVDWILNITGEAPHTVFALAHAFHDDMKAIGDVDTAGVIMKFPSGVIAQMDMSREAVYGYDQRVEVFGSKGMLTGQNTCPTGAVMCNKDGITNDKFHVSFPQRYVEAYAAEMEHFLDVVFKKVEAEVTKNDALLVNRVAEAIDQSWKTGKPVTIE